MSTVAGAMQQGLSQTAVRTSWWMVAVLFGFYVLSFLDRMIVAMLVTPIKADLSLSDIQISMVTSTSFALFYAVFGLPLGWAADRFSRRIIIFCGVVLWTTATIACGLARSYEALLTARVFVAVGEAALLPSAYSLISDGFSREKLTLATSVFQMAAKVGLAASFGLGGIAIAYATSLGEIGLPYYGSIRSWQIVMVMVGLPGLVLAPLVFTFRDPGRNQASPKAAQPGLESVLFGFLRSHWQLVALMLIGASCLSICIYSMNSWIPAFIERQFGWEPGRYGLALSAMSILAAFAAVAAGGVVDRLFAGGMKDVHLRYFSFINLAAVPVVAYMFFAEDVYVFLLCYCVAQFVVLPMVVYIWSVMTMLAPGEIRGRLLSMFLLVFTILGMGAGPAIVGALTDLVFRDEAQLGYSLAIVCIAGTAIAGGTFGIALRYYRAAIARKEASAPAAD